ncbi:N-acetylglucosamine kinase 1 [Sporothrix epigloea]|uniref:Phosphotransferase n=1 Tax=Sporothrix epigloea TaxID=1892477 RepID=A0ABP0D3I9_9PEZI
MLPSYIHQLPDGSELGRFLSLDVGGSTLRVALIELRGNSTAQGVESMEILRKDTYKITPELKSLEGMKFFDWIAVRILEVMSQDLGDVIQTACIGRGLRVKVAAVVNDSAAALLSAAYIQNATRFGLVLGTGVNIAIHLPVRAVGTAKFGARPATWFDEASHVIVNTELGMFGHGILPVTRWDALLNEQHLKPDFQPLEYMVSGCYLGEIARLALLEAVESAGLFGGDVPPSLLTPYALDTETLSVMETDKSSSLELATSVFHEKHPTGSGAPLSIADIRVVCTLASLIAQRSAAILGASVYALWALKVETERELIEANLVEAHTRNAQAELAILQSRTVVAFNGSVMEQYPHYREHCQAVIDSLATEKTSATTSTIDLVPAEESSLLGAVVALACLRAE